jgi:hypothetical protein
MGGVYIEKGPAPEHRWVAKLGAGLAIQKFDGAEPWWGFGDLSAAKGAALDLSLGYNRDFKYGSSWYWGGKLGVGLNFMSQHYDEGIAYHKDWNHGGDTATESFDAQSIGSTIGILHIGPTIGFRKPVGNNMKLDINFTPEFVYTWNGDGDGKDFNYTSTYPNGDISEDSAYVYFDDFSNVAASATLGVDLWINKFIVGVNYRYVFNFDYIQGGPQTIMMNVGFAF